MTLGSLFDGAGGFPFAGQICGIEPIWASEIESFPVKVTSKRFPNMKHLGDITKINGAEIEPVDIITFGSPCQDLSVAGRQVGLAGEQSGLFMEAVRIIKEMRGKTNGRKPTLAVWENVPGAFSSNKGEDFRVVIEELCKVEDGGAVIPRPPKGKWADAGEIVGDGYSVAWRVLDAQFWGVPQRRRRVFLVADFGGECAGEILFEREGLSRNFAESRKSWKGITKSLAFGFGNTSKAYGICSYDSNAMKSANPHSGVYEADTARMLDENDGNPSCNQGGMAIVVGADMYNQDLSEDKSASVGSNCGLSTGRNGVICLSVENHPNDSRCKLDDRDQCQTLSSRMGTGGNNVPMVLFCKTYRKTAHPMHVDEAQGWEENVVTDTLNVYDNSEARTPQVVLCVRERCGCAGGGKGLLIQDDAINTIQTSNDQFVCYALDRSAYNQGQNAKFDMGIDEEGTAYTVVAKGPGAVCYAIGNGQADQTGLSDIPGALNCMHDQQAVLVMCGDIIVRRLTPTECARLQGMPDWWCDDVPHADSAEYKMWGNGMALPCVLYVMEGVAKLLKERENDET